MIMADVFTFVFIILGLWLALPALCLVLRACYPRLVERAGERAAGSTWRLVFASVLVVVPGFLAVAALGSQPGAAKPIAVLLGAAGFLYAFVGISGIVTHLGTRLPSPRDQERPWLPTVRGAVCLEMAATLPILGWYLLCPLTLFFGAGATTLALFSTETPAAPAADESTNPAESTDADAEVATPTDLQTVAV